MKRLNDIITEAVKAKMCEIVDIAIKNDYIFTYNILEKDYFLFTIKINNKIIKINYTNEVDKTLVKTIDDLLADMTGEF